MNKIVITGGTYAGKTSLVDEFGKLGYPIIQESGLQIINELNEKMGMEKQREWRAKNPEEFYVMIAERQLKLESIIRSEEKPIFLDRGFHDYLAFCKLVNIKVPSRILELVQNITYNKAFLCQTLSGFDNRIQTGRSITKEQSIKLANIIGEVYREYGIDVINIEDIPINQRIEEIKKILQL